MFKRTLFTLLTACSLALGSTATSKIAQIDEPIIVEKTRDFYAGVGLSSNETWARDSVEDFTKWSSDEYTNLGLSLIFGYDAIRFDKTDTYIEIRTGQSYWMEDSENFTTTYISILAKPTYNITKRLAMYGLIGFTYVDWSSDISNFSHNANSLSVGLGAIAEVNENWYVGADYLFSATDAYSEYLKTNVNFSQVMISLLYKF